MRKIIASLSGITLSLTPAIGLMNSSYTEKVNYLQEETVGSTVEKATDEKETVNSDALNAISQVDLQTLNELLKIVKEKQEIKSDSKKSGSSLSIMGKIGSFAISAKDILMKILKDIVAAASTALISIKEELGKVFL